MTFSALKTSIDFELIQNCKEVNSYHTVESTENIHNSQPGPRARLFVGLLVCLLLFILVPNKVSSVWINHWSVSYDRDKSGPLGPSGWPSETRSSEWSSWVGRVTRRYNPKSIISIAKSHSRSKCEPSCQSPSREIIDK